MATVIEIIADHLRNIGADGLVCPAADCGCELSDMAPCGGSICDCQPGWKGAPIDPDHGDWTMFTSKEAAAGQEGGAPC